KAVGDDIEKLAFNRAIARIHELANVLAGPLGGVAEGRADQATRAACREAVTILIRMIAPFMPHLAEECHATLGGEQLVAELPWPTFDPALAVDSAMSLPVQVN